MIRSSTASNYTVTGLQPYQLVFVMISASTEAGEGPVSEVVAGRATELGMVIQTTNQLDRSKFSCLCKNTSELH